MVITLTIDSNYCRADEIDATLEAIATAATITTYYDTIIARVGGDKFYVAIIYA